MQDRLLSLSAATILAAALMLIGLGLLVANWFLPGEDLGFASMPFFATSAVARIRALLCRMGGLVQDAYEMGKEVGREEGGNQVRNLR